CSTVTSAAPATPATRIPATAADSADEEISFQCRLVRIEWSHGEYTDPDCHGPRSTGTGCANGRVRGRFSGPLDGKPTRALGRAIRRRSSGRSGRGKGGGAEGRFGRSPGRRVDFLFKGGENLRGTGPAIATGQCRSRWLRPS